MADKWIQKAVSEKEKGSTKAYIRRKYGKKAFTKDGNLKVSYIKKAIAECKKNEQCGRSLMGKLQFALRAARGEL